MADNAGEAGGRQDRLRIDVTRDDQLRDWARKFQVTPDQIREAVRAVGDQPEAVEMHLRGSHATTDSERMEAAKDARP